MDNIWRCFISEFSSEIAHFLKCSSWNGTLFIGTLTSFLTFAKDRFRFHCIIQKSRISHSKSSDGHKTICKSYFLVSTKHHLLSNGLNLHLEWEWCSPNLPYREQLSSYFLDGIRLTWLTLLPETFHFFLQFATYLIMCRPKSFRSIIPGWRKSSRIYSGKISPISPPPSSQTITFFMSQQDGRNNPDLNINLLARKKEYMKERAYKADCPPMSFVFVCWHSRKWWPPICGGTL